MIVTKDYASKVRPKAFYRVGCYATAELEYLLLVIDCVVLVALLGKTIVDF